MTTKTSTPSTAELRDAAEKAQAHADSFGAKRVAIHRSREDKVHAAAQALTRGDEQTATDIQAEIAREDIWLGISVEAERGAIQEANRAHAAHAEAASPEAIEAARAFAERLEQLLAQVAQVAQQASAAKRRVWELHRLRCRPLSPHDEPPEPVIPLSGQAQRMFAAVTGTNWNR